MENKIKAPYLPYEDIRDRANSFLAQYHPSRDIPVPIEEIVDFQMGINIVPLPGLKKHYDIDGFTSCDLSIINVDQSIYEHRCLNRYRFTLAHEVGHIILHKNIYEKANFRDTQGWKDFVNSIPEKEYSFLEYHAYSFGGLILIPTEHLERLTKDAVNLILSWEVSLRDNWDFAWDCVARELTKDFKVSTDAIMKSLEKDKIFDQYR